MYAYNEFPNIILDLDGDRCPDACEPAIEAIAYGATDFVDLTNEGYPSCLGNGYARYEFVAFNDGYVFTYYFGPIELDKLRREGAVTLKPLPWNDLDEVRAVLNA